MLRIEAPPVEKVHFIGEKLPLMDFSYEGSMLNLAVQFRNLKLIDSTVFHIVMDFFSFPPKLGFFFLF